MRKYALIFDLKLSKSEFVNQAGNKAFNETDFKPIITNSNENMKKETKFEGHLGNCKCYVIYE